MATNITPLSRTLRLINPKFEHLPWENQRTVVLDTPRILPEWVGQATDLERVGLAKYASEELEQYGPLTPLEMLAATTTASPERKNILLDGVHRQNAQLSPEYLKACVHPDWSLGKHTVWEDFALDTQLLIARYASLRNDILRPRYSGEFSEFDVAKVMAASPEEVQADVMLQRITACNNPGVFSIQMNTNRQLDAQAIAINFLHGRYLTPSWYARMDDDAFARLVAYDPQEDRLTCILDHNKSLYRYPWDKMHLVLEHNPVLLLASILANREVNNAQPYVGRHFKPMLASIVQFIDESPLYAQRMLHSITADYGKKHFPRTIERHAPEEYSKLQIITGLHGHDNLINKDVLLAWVQSMAIQQSSLDSLPFTNAMLEAMV